MKHDLDATLLDLALRLKHKHDFDATLLDLFLHLKHDLDATLFDLALHLKDLFGGGTCKGPCACVGFDTDGSSVDYTYVGQGLIGAGVGASCM